MSEHTAGPWHYSSGMVWAGSEEEVAIARMDRDTPLTKPVERDANARLIAAAPELNDSCSYLDYAAEGTGYEGADDDEIIEIRLTARALKDNRAAIAKARGEQS